MYIDIGGIYVSGLWNIVIRLQLNMFDLGLWVLIQKLLYFRFQYLLADLSLSPAINNIVLSAP